MLGFLIFNAFCFFSLAAPADINFTQHSNQVGEWEEKDVKESVDDSPSCVLGVGEGQKDERRDQRTGKKSGTQSKIAGSVEIISELGTEVGEYQFGFF